MTVTTSRWRLAFRAFFTIALQTCQLCPAGATDTCSSLLLSSPIAEQDTETVSIALQCFELDNLNTTHNARLLPGRCQAKLLLTFSVYQASLACHGGQCSKPDMSQRAVQQAWHVTVGMQQALHVTVGSAASLALALWINFLASLLKHRLSLKLRTEVLAGVQVWSAWRAHVKAWVRSPALSKLGMVAHVCHPIVQV